MFCRHIYIPLGGSRHGPLWQFLAAVACFSFTCFWHGALDYILAWTAFNLVIVGGEALAYYVVDKPQVKEFEVHVMFKWSFVRERNLELSEQSLSPTQMLAPTHACIRYPIW